MADSMGYGYDGSMCWDGQWGWENTAWSEQWPCGNVTFFVPMSPVGVHAQPVPSAAALAAAAAAGPPSTVADAASAAEGTGSAAETSAGTGGEVRPQTTARAELEAKIVAWPGGRRGRWMKTGDQNGSDVGGS